jgi:putative endonuclease
VENRRAQLGQAGESAAAQHLIRRGFSILERNFRTRWGELDIVAYDGRALVFVEVKSRRVAPGEAAGAGGALAGATGAGGAIRAPGVFPLESLHPRKRRQVRRMAGRWLSQRQDHPRAALIRFDAVGVTFDRAGRLVSLEHLEGAF